MITKHRIVLRQADREKIKRYLLISASNIFATNALINCDANTPIARPAAREPIPTTRVSRTRIADTFLFPIPNVR